MSLPAWIFASSDDASATPSGERRDREAGSAPAVNPSSPDAPLLARLRAGDASALDEVYRAWYPELFRFATLTGPSASVAEEIVQDVFAALWEGRERLAIRDSIRAYLFTAVRYRALNARRSAGTIKRLAPYLREDVEHTYPVVLPDAELMSAEERTAVIAAIAQLSDRQREAITLRMHSGLSYEETGSVLGISPDAARMLVNRALRGLREILAPYLDG